MLSKRAHRGLSIYRQCSYICARCEIGESRLHHASSFSSSKPNLSFQTRHSSSVTNPRVRDDTGESVSSPAELKGNAKATFPSGIQSQTRARERPEKPPLKDSQQNQELLPEQSPVRRALEESPLQNGKKPLVRRKKGSQRTARFRKIKNGPLIRRPSTYGQSLNVLKGHQSLEDALAGQPVPLSSKTNGQVKSRRMPASSDERREKARTAYVRAALTRAALRAEAVNLKGAEKLELRNIKFTAVPEDIPPVPRLAHGLQRVLFNRGVYQFRDLHSRVYNFDPSLELITPVTEIDFNSLKGFTPSSEDSTLTCIAMKNGKKYTGSTSSMTGVLKHFHFLLSKFRPVNMDMLSSQVRETLPPTFTKITAAPDAIFLRWKNGTYAIDSDKEFDSNNVLSFMGRFMEKLLTVDREAFERYKKGKSNPISNDELEADETYHYSTIGDILMRSQLDAYDPRLPGTGMFDLKTRAVMPIRMDSSNPEPLIGYELRETLGMWESYEREYADMMRSTLLKYSLQVRMGRMDGIFVAYHNITRLFGFQYLSLDEIDLALHGQSDRTLGDTEFLYSVHLLNKVLDEATKKFPERSLRIHFETREPLMKQAFGMEIFAEPITEEEIVAIQSTNKAKAEEWERIFLRDGLVSSDETTTATEASTSVSSLEPAAAAAKHPQTESIPTPEHQAATDAADPSPTTKPFVHLKLRITSTQNGSPVLRPEHLLVARHWAAHSHFTEQPDQPTALKAYEACKGRRKKLLDLDARKHRDYFMNMLKNYVSKGKAWREMIDARDNEEEKRRGGVLVWDKEEPVRRAGGGEYVGEHARK